MLRKGKQRERHQGKEGGEESARGRGRQAAGEKTKWREDAGRDCKSTEHNGGGRRKLDGEEESN